MLLKLKNSISLNVEQSLSIVKQKNRFFININQQIFKQNQFF